MVQSERKRGGTSPATVLDLDEDGEDIDQKLYRGMIGSLLYLTASRPDIMFSVCKCACFQWAPKTSHLAAVKQIIRYLCGTLSYGLWYHQSKFFHLLGYSDADYAGDRVDRKSTSGTCEFLGKSLVSWHNKMQESVALSAAEAEYIALGQCCTQVLWMASQLMDYGINVKPVPLLCDNKSAIQISKNPVDHSRTKHIDVRHHFIHDHIS